MLRKIRIPLAAVCFLLITWLFLDFTGVAHLYVGWLAKLQFLPAILALNVVVIVGLVLLTLIFGRIYCSVICPLGVMQDIIARLHPKGKNKAGRYSYSPERRWLRYAVLVLFIIAIIAGIGSFVALLEPYSSFGRIVSNLLKPLWLSGNNVLAEIAESHDSYAFYEVPIWIRSMPTFIIAAATLLVVSVLAWLGGRTYCNTICPVGSILGLLSRWSLFRVSFDVEKCRNCSACSRACKASCIDFKNHNVDYSRCVVCGDCIDKCQFGALKYDISAIHAKAGHTTASATATSSAEATIETASSQPKAKGLEAGGDSRRAFLIGTALAATTATVAQTKRKVDGGLAEIEDKKAPERKTKLTPPGSLSARNFYQHCTGCQLCVTQCPNEVLRPSTGLLTLMQPTMSYENGFCRPECTRCSEVCPAGAIRPITKEEKSSTQIGHAVWIKKNCIVLTDGVSCGNCERHCPAGAIQMVPLHPEDELGAYVPAINESKCIGCGACEYHCPARPFSAIYVEGHETHKQV
ncbi:MAG: 4Fe-4S binding protein [Bacteroidaceae bacterium]|nr:4Fe-4S binding protein [Bacteroidaceae bacterium]